MKITIYTVLKYLNIKAKINKVKYIQVDSKGHVQTTREGLSDHEEQEFTGTGAQKYDRDSAIALRPWLKEKVLKVWKDLYITKNVIEGQNIYGKYYN